MLVEKRALLRMSGRAVHDHEGAWLTQARDSVQEGRRLRRPSRTSSGWRSSASTTAARSRPRSVEGWAFFELELIDAEKGGAPRAHVDALRLLAVFLAHWDNKSENQRLVCLRRRTGQRAASARSRSRCCRTWALRSGQSKSRSEGMGTRRRSGPTARTCTASMETLPDQGGHVHAGEDHRRRPTHARPRCLSAARSAADGPLHAAARFDQTRNGLHPRHDSTPMAEWVRVFKRKVSRSPRACVSAVGEALQSAVGRRSDPASTVSPFRLIA